MKAVYVIKQEVKLAVQKLSKVIKQTYKFIDNPKLKWIMSIIIKTMVKRIIDLLITLM